MEDAANNIVAHYEHHALSWDADRRAAGWTDKPYIERFLEALPTDATVLDLGCGGGDPVALHMTARGFHVTGVDSSPTLISLCQNRMPDQWWIAADWRSASDFRESWPGTASFTFPATTSGRCFLCSRPTRARAPS